MPFIPSEDPTQRLKQMGTLASALTALQMEFSDDLTYLPGMAPQLANQAKFEQGGMQVRFWNFSFQPYIISKPLTVLYCMLFALLVP